MSTDRQAERGLGLDVQAEAVSRWASSEGVELVAVLRDEGVSGALEAADRPGLSDALRMVADGEANVFVVARLDRLARSLSVQEACLARLWKWNARVFACDLGEILHDDAADPMRTALRQMVAVFGQLERALIAARMREGRRHKALAGGYAYGAPPFGFRSQDGVLQPDPSEQRTLARIAELRQHGHTLREIADVLDREGHRPRRSGTWHPQTLARILHRHLEQCS